MEILYGQKILLIQYKDLRIPEGKKLLGTTNININIALLLM